MMRKSHVSLKQLFTNKVICLSLRIGPDLSLLFAFSWGCVFIVLCPAILHRLSFVCLSYISREREGLPGVLMGISVKMWHHGQATSLPSILSALCDCWLVPPHCHCWCHQHPSKASCAEVTFIYLLGHTRKQYSGRLLSPHMFCW